MLCSVCLRFAEKTISLLADQLMDLGVLELIDKHLNVKAKSVSKGEECRICDECWTKLKDFHDFYEYVAKAHNAQCDVLDQVSAYGVTEIDVVNIKQECLDDAYHKTDIEEINFIETDNLDELNPLLKCEVEENARDELCLDDNECKISKPSLRKRKLGKRKKLPSTESDSYAEDDSDEKIPTKRSKLKRKVQIKAGNGKPETNTDSFNINCKSGQLPKRRIGLAMSLENEKLIKKHITMSCEVCPHICEDFQDLLAHFRLNHTDIRPHIKCCGRKLDCPSYILQHAYYHEDPECFKCTECGKSFKNNSGLRDHYLKSHEPEENLSFACDQCPRRFARRNLLEHHHAKHVPKKERSFFCEICQPKRAFANDYTLQIHIKNRHCKESNICHVCAKEIRDKQAFEKHVRLHFEISGPRVKCPREGCESRLKDMDSLKQHLRRFHDTQQYECPQCERVCKNKNALSNHLKATHPKILYNCEECQKSFKSQLTLKEHMARHAGEALYSCPFCSRTFNSKANMYSHKKKAHPKEWQQCQQIKSGSKNKDIVIK